MLKIYNSLTRVEEPFVPLDPARVRMYVCGITVYDFCHLGHARMMIVFDIVQRWLRASGYPLTYARWGCRSPTTSRGQPTTLQRCWRGSGGWRSAASPIGRKAAT